MRWWRSWGRFNCFLWLGDGEGFAATVFDVPFNFSVGNVSGEYSINTYLQVVEYKYHGDTNNILLKLVEAYYDFAKKCQQV